MKLAGITSGAGANNVKGTFGIQDGPSIILDLTQGAHGRAFCGTASYDLPDPRSQMVRINNPKAALEIVSSHGVPSQLGEINVASLKVEGDIRLPVLRTKRMDLNHASVESNEVSGALSDDPLMEPQPVDEINLRDSRLTCQGELSFLNVAADDRTSSYVNAKYLEGWTMQGRLVVHANHLMVGVLEAQEVQVEHPEGCHVAQIFCKNVLHSRGLGNAVPTRPVYDRDLADSMNAMSSMDLPDAPESTGPGFEM
jgi:hypothetical protein